ncbi:MAG: DUF4244 domain-containing protein [Actinomycetaceae bacterium]|nr:DUF4244 domain-containing protein [Actinomycetaceae bacterium]
MSAKRETRIFRKNRNPFSGDIDRRDEGGFVTAEYAVGILAAVAFAGVLLAVLKSGAVRTLLVELIKMALSV